MRRFLVLSLPLVLPPFLVQPSMRPTVVEILGKPFMQQALAKFAEKEKKAGSQCLARLLQVRVWPCWMHVELCERGDYPPPHPFHSRTRTHNSPSHVVGHSFCT
jgi:hypothetical protein